MSNFSNNSSPSNNYIQNIKKRKNVQCPFCKAISTNREFQVIYLEVNRCKTAVINYMAQDEQEIFPKEKFDEVELNEKADDYIIVEFLQCTSCDHTSIKVHYPFLNQVIGIHPQFNEPVLPDYIPQSIKQDYKEACMIAELSPRAAAILLRRCLQEMLRDLTGKRQNLYEEINNFALKTNTDITILDALNATRQIGNIGAHPEDNIDNIIDISREEAEVLLKFIMHFIEEWYIRPHDVEETANELIRINNEKQKQKKQT